MLSSMIPLFKTDSSIGKSILTTKDPKKCKEGGPDSIFQIAEENNLKQLVLVEDSMIGFLECFNKCKAKGIQLIFGLRVKVESGDKIIIFAKNDEGCKLLNKIYSNAFGENKGLLSYEYLKKVWSNDLTLSIPFYDSFIFHNLMYFEQCIPDFSFVKPTIFIENNGLPFDVMIYSEAMKFAERNGLKTIPVKSIYYKNKDDFDAYVTYKCVCNRRMGRARTLGAPGFDYLASRNFCWESYLEQSKKQS